MLVRSVKKGSLPESLAHKRDLGGSVSLLGGRKKGEKEGKRKKIVGLFAALWTHLCLGKTGKK